MDFENTLHFSSASQNSRMSRAKIKFHFRDIKFKKKLYKFKWKEKSSDKVDKSLLKLKINLLEFFA